MKVQNLISKLLEQNHRQCLNKTIEKLHFPADCGILTFSLLFQNPQKRTTYRSKELDFLYKSGLLTPLSKLTLKDRIHKYFGVDEFRNIEFRQYFDYVFTMLIASTKAMEPTRSPFNSVSKHVPRSPPKCARIEKIEVGT
jgi:hypothetical protein